MNVNPVFLSLGEVLKIHRDRIERYGGKPGIRELGLLQSALAMPAAGFGGRYLHTNLFEMAAAYFFHIFCARRFAISVCRGIVSTAPVSGLIQTE